MSWIGSRWALLVVLSVTAATAFAGPAKYLDNKTLNRRLTSLAARDPNLMTVTRLSGGGVHRSSIAELGGKGDKTVRPAMLVVAGIEGNDLAGPTIAMAWIEQLLAGYGEDEGITALLDSTTIYVLARLNTRAAASFFAEPKYETSRTPKPFDDDHDGLKDEDGPDDLNGDGLITSMRIRRRDGKHILDPTDERLLIEADRLKGEAGQWLYLPEGLDNDKDEQFNEDGPGGVNFNRNFPYNYEFFASDAGLHQVSESETRALADFVSEHSNIALVVTFGQADNLLATPESAEPEGRQPMTAIDEADIGYYSAMGELYRQTLGLEGTLETKSHGGTFSDWMYFHRGRLSMAINPWSPQLAMKMATSKGKKSKDQDESKGEPDDDRNRDEREQLTWFDENAPDAFIPWKPVDHPDLPGEEVEVGGYAPFALTNPPAGMLGRLVKKQTAFLTAAASKPAKVEIANVEVKNLGKGIYDITIEIANSGFLPTSLAQGERSRRVHPTRLVIDLPDKSFLSGGAITMLPIIAGSGGVAEVRCVVHAGDRRKIEFEVISMIAARAAGVVDLSEQEKSK